VVTLELFFLYFISLQIYSTVIQFVWDFDFRLETGVFFEMFSPQSYCIEIRPKQLILARDCVVCAIKRQDTLDSLGCELVGVVKKKTRQEDPHRIGDVVILLKG
jgi:hypothetical protein